MPPVLCGYPYDGTIYTLVSTITFVPGITWLHHEIVALIPSSSSLALHSTFSPLLWELNKNWCWHLWVQLSTDAALSGLFLEARCNCDTHHPIHINCMTRRALSSCCLNTKCSHSRFVIPHYLHREATPNTVPRTINYHIVMYSRKKLNLVCNYILVYPVRKKSASL